MLRNRIIKSIAAAILAVIVFVFIYSELGQFGYTGDNPSSHDYCEIVKATLTQTGKVAINDLFKLKVEKQICIHCNYDSIEQSLSYIQLDLEHFHTPPQTTTNKIYLYNRVFLI